MKAGKKKRRSPLLVEAQGGFVRGFVATSLLLAIQENAGKSPRRLLRLAAQGGCAMAAASAAAAALDDGRPAAALLAVGAGGLSMALAQHYLADPDAGSEIVEPH